MNHFVLDFTQGELAKVPNLYATTKKKVQEKDPDLKNDPLVVFKDPEQRIEVGYCYKDLLNRHPEFKTTVLIDIGEKVLKQPPGGKNNEDWYKLFGTDEGKAARTDFVLTAREKLRQEDYQDAPQLAPPNPQSKDEDNLKTMLGGSGKGLCFGGQHNDKTRDGLVQSMLASDDHGGVDMFFIEELGIIDQDDVDTFIASGKAGKMSKYLATKIKGYPGVVKILEFARDYNDGKEEKNHIKIFGIDSGEAEQPDGLLSLEGRAASMNFVAQDVMDKATKKYPNKKFLAYCGAAHSNTHPGGVPGLSQMFGVPAIRIGGTSTEPRIQLDLEDKSLRGMPTAEEIKEMQRIEALEGVGTLDTNPKRHQKVQVLASRARVATCQKELAKVKPLREQLAVAQKTLKEKNEADTPSPQEIKEAQEVVDDLKKQLLAAETEARRLTKEYATDYPQVASLRGPANQTLEHSAKEAGLDDLAQDLDKQEKAQFIADLDAKAAVAAKAAFAKLPNVGSMDEQEKKKQMKALLAQARFAEAQNSLMGPYISLRKEITESEQMHAQSKSKGTATDESTRKHESRIAALHEQIEGLRVDMEKRLPAYLERRPELLDLTDKDGMTLLHFAAVQGNPGVLAYIGDKKKSLINQPDAKGNTAAHYVLQRRDFLDDDLRESQLKAQASGLDELLSRGADPDLQNKEKKTALHYAALTGNGEAADALIKANANVTIKDGRGWTAFDTCLGSTKPSVEKVFYANNMASPKYVPEKPNQSVVDILTQVTKCENPAQEKGIRDMYLRMYAEPKLRPILEAAAVDAMQDREPPKEGGVRIFVADAPATGLLYASPSWYAGGEGGYDEEANSFLLAGKPDPGKDPREGVLIHEMTHMVTRKMFGTDTVPYGNDQDKQKYKTAILHDVKGMHLMNATDPAEKRLKDRLCDRMETYANRGGDDQLLQEYIVGIPQLIAEYGADVVKKYAPALMNYYDEFTAQTRNRIKTDDKYKGLFAKIDNTKLDLELQTTPPVLPTAPTGWLKNDTADLQVDALMLKIRAEYAMRHGVPELPQGATIPYSAKIYKVKPEDKDLFEQKMEKVKAGLTASLQNGELASQVESNGIRTLILDSVELAEKLAPDQLEAAVAGQTTNWVRETKVEYMNRQIDEGQTPDTREFVEATLLLAQRLAFANLGNNDPSAVVEIDPGKREDLIKALGKDLDKRIKGGLTQDKFNGLMTQLANAIANSPKSPFSIKKKNLVNDPTHVSVDKSALKNAWLKKLKTL